MELEIPDAFALGIFPIKATALMESHQGCFFCYNLRCFTVSQ